MGYIYEDELKEILPEIMSDWIDKDDESWEWIFQEIEQKCYVGTNKKKGKQWRKYIEDVVGDLKQRVDELSNKVSKLNDICNSHTVRLDRMGQDITAAKSMAQTAKQRTEIDYTKCSKEKSDADIEVQKKECASCKHYMIRAFDTPPCGYCDDHDKWEAKENDSHSSI